MSYASPQQCGLSVGQYQSLSAHKISITPVA